MLTRHTGHTVVSDIQRELLTGRGEDHVVIRQVIQEQIPGLGVHYDHIGGVACLHEIDDLLVIRMCGEVVLLATGSATATP